MSSYDTIVIGAGAAGLMAGLELARAGQRVVILEARSRIGGRILTHHHDVPLELGAEFIHGLPEATWALVREGNLPTLELGGTPYRYRESTLQAAGEEPARAFDTLERLSRWLKTQPPGTDLSFERFLPLAGITGEQAEQASRYVEGFNAADQRQISVLALDRQQQAEDAIQADRLFHLPRGYDTLPRYLADAFEGAGGVLRLEHRVQAIHWRRDAIRVEASEGAGRALTARRLVVTVPLGVLQAGSLRFSPEVPTLTGALAGLRMGPVLRVALLFRQRFWSSMAPDMLFLFSTDQLIPTWWSAHPDSAPLLTGWVGGTKAWERLGNLRDGALIEAALQQLAAMFKLPSGHLRKQLLAGESHDWMADPLARGAYSYARVGGVDASTQLAGAVEETLFFAGEHTDTEGHWGTVHAALSSGRRAASTLLSLA